MATAPTLDSVESTAKREVDLDWTREDDESDGDFRVRRRLESESGDGEELTSINRDTTEFTDDDSELLDGESYEYRIERVTSTETTASEWVGEVVWVPSIDDLSADGGDRSATLDWTEPTNNTDRHEIRIREDDTGEWGIVGEVGGASDGADLSHDLSDLLDGQRYGVSIRTLTPDGAAISGVDVQADRTFVVESDETKTVDSPFAVSGRVEISGQLEITE